MSTDTIAAESTEPFIWKTHPVAARWVRHSLEAMQTRNPILEKLAYVLREFTGTRLVDWVDHIALSDVDSLGLISELPDVGYHANAECGQTVWRHKLGMFPPVLVSAGRTGIGLRCDSVDAAARALPLSLGLTSIDAEQIVGPRGGRFRYVALSEQVDAEVWLVERHGFDSFGCVIDTPAQIAAAATHLEYFSTRKRDFATFDDGFDEAANLFKAAADELGTDWACDLFFIAERKYWQRRNRAGTIQHERQNRLGLGWANHDHHTYRSSRAAFPRLIETLELMGFECRERFYAGREAGWGAQVIEQPRAGVVIFADVDLSPEEVANDFAHQPLAQRDQLGTVGLWCELHGEAFLEAGMHHLECQFDFDAARAQLAAHGIDSMAPFTDFPHLRQAFTRGEVWPVDPLRLERLTVQNLITPEQSDRFRHDGAIGSHLEILERNDGYKGFNQTGISEIIARTDPRCVSANT